MGQKTLTSKVRRYLRRYDLRIRLIQDWPKFKICITPFPVSLTRGRTRFWSVVIYLGSRMFCFLWRLVRPSQNGERAGPLAKMLLGAKTRRATSDWVAHYRRGVFRSLSVPNVFYSDVLSFRSKYRDLLHIFGRVTKV